MAEETKSKKKLVAQPAPAPSAASIGPAERPERDNRRGGGNRDGRGGPRRGRGPRRDNDAEREFDQKIVDLARVTRVMAGGKRMRFRACVVIGDRQGKVGVGLGKGADVSLAITKAVASAKKDMVTIPLHEETIPHAITVKLGASKILLKPAPRGTGVIAGGAIRSVLDLGGVPNVAAKTLGSRNKVNNARAAVLALKELMPQPKKEKEEKGK